MNCRLDPNGLFCVIDDITVTKTDNELPPAGRELKTRCDSVFSSEASLCFPNFERYQILGGTAAETYSCPRKGCYLCKFNQTYLGNCHGPGLCLEADGRTRALSFPSWLDVGWPPGIWSAKRSI